MVNGISSSAASYTGASMQAAQVQAVQSTVATPATARVPPQEDSVSLSAPAQAHAMQQQGMAVHAIAANMGTTTRTVNSYLGITSTSFGAAGGGSMAELKNVAAHVRVIPASSGLPSPAKKAA
jgi:hypothetical protein